jgi:chemotaxis response regulator CheB
MGIAFSEKTEPNFPVVCLGGSAGALEGFREILRNVPADCGIAFVVISHRGPAAENGLVFLLQRVTKMEVVEIEEGMALQPNCVYVNPYYQDVSTDGEALFLGERSKPKGWPITITLFLRSLADACGSRVTAVILSGMGYDGSEALRAVRAAGGAVFAQSGGDYTEMPDHAVSTGYVNFIASAAGIGKRLTAMGRARQLREQGQMQG